MSRVLFIECVSGVAGDMLLGALLDAGLPEQDLRRTLASLAVPHELRVSRVVRAGVTATKVDVVPVDAPAAAAVVGPHRHGTRGKLHVHPHGTLAHRSLADITHLLDHSELDPAVRRKAVALFRRLAEVEAAIHNMPVEAVHLHEVGAVDSIVDIVGCVFGLHWFGADEVVVSPLNLGSGSVAIAHGVFPVPAPATLALVTGVPVYAEGPAVELTTPTGALLVTGHATRFDRMPGMVVHRTGYGAGTKDFAEPPNVVRVVVGEASARPSSGRPDVVVKIECEIDDMNPQLFGAAMDDLLAAGALDVFLTPVQMKKQRPGTLLTVIAPTALCDALTRIVFRHTTTLGVRYVEMARDVLARRHVVVDVDGVPVRVKLGERDGEVLNAAPEFDDCLAAARRLDQPVKRVQAEVMRLWLNGKAQETVSAPRTARPRSRPRASRPGRAAPRGRNAPRGKR